ncbi:retrovirus-related Pol polyprotein [Pycnococcus provasolii]
MQKTIALSTVEAEYTALVHALQEAIFLRKLLVALGEDMSQPIVLYEDNNGAACLVDHPTSHARTKHIDIKRRWLDSYLQGPEPQFIVRRIPTADNVADIMTKSLAAGPHEKHTSGLLAWIGSALRSITNCCNSR